MSMEFYEVWSRDEDDHEELVETTVSKKHAIQLAKKCLEDGFVAGIVYQEDENGDLGEIERFERS